MRVSKKAQVRPLLRPKPEDRELVLLLNADEVRRLGRGRGGDASRFRASLGGCRKVDQREISGGQAHRRREFEKLTGDGGGLGLASSGRLVSQCLFASGGRRGLGGGRCGVPRLLAVSALGTLPAVGLEASVASPRPVESFTSPCPLDESATEASRPLGVVVPTVVDDRRSRVEERDRLSILVHELAGGSVGNASWVVVGEVDDHGDVGRGFLAVKGGRDDLAAEEGRASVETLLDEAVGGKRSQSTKSVIASQA